MKLDASKALVTTTTILASMNRRTNTVNGGPRYALLTSDGRVFLTADDTADDTADSYGWVPERLTGIPVKLTVASGYVIGIDPV